jgi:hypothetical protein
MKIAKATTLAGFVAAALAASQAGAVELGNGVELHGYGSQTYMQTTTNTYPWDNNFLGLVGTVTLNDKSKLWAQLETSSTDLTRFTWFFVDYQFTDDLRAHVGRVKYPLGLYNEIIDAKMLQLSSLEPMMYQQAADFVHDAYTGVGLDYDQSLGNAGSITWQAYGGNTYDTNPPVDSRDRRIFGGRVTYNTPIDGLRFMVSGYRTKVEILADQSFTNETREIFSVDYTHNDWDIKSEYAKHSFQGVNSDAWYVQLGKTFADKWTPYARYDYVTTDKSQKSDESFYQKTTVVGVGYKIKSNISLRVEEHFNNGYALPVASGEVLAGEGVRKWNMFVAGVHFAF